MTRGKQACPLCGVVAEIVEVQRRGVEMGVLKAHYVPKKPAEVAQLCHMSGLGGLPPARWPATPKARR